MIADKGSPSNDRDIANARKKLGNADIRVIPVSFGADADKNQMLKTTQDPRNLIEATDSEKPSILGEKIMDKIITGE